MTDGPKRLIQSSAQYNICTLTVHNSPRKMESKFCTTALL